jgi:hypothetical protein
MAKKTNVYLTILLLIVFCDIFYIGWLEYKWSLH